MALLTVCLGGYGCTKGKADIVANLQAERDSARRSQEWAILKADRENDPALKKQYLDEAEEARQKAAELNRTIRGLLAKD